MKTICLCFLAFSFTPLYLAAQEEDYCPCQESVKQSQEIFDFVGLVNSDISMMIPQNVNTVFVLPAVQKEEPKLLEDELKLKQEKPEKIANEEFVLSVKPDQAPKEKSGIMKAKTKLKKSKKRSKRKIKNKKKARKYKGQCPFF